MYPKTAPGETIFAHEGPFRVDSPKTKTFLPPHHSALSLGSCIAIIAGCMTVLVAFIFVCTHFYKKRMSSKSYRYNHMSSKTANALTRHPLLLDQEKGNTKKPSKSDAGNTTKGSVVVGNSPLRDSTCETKRVQPLTGDLSQSFDSLRSSVSSLELDIPAAPTDLGGEELGSIYFNLSYDRVQSILKLTIHRAVNLLGKDISGTSDPYVKILLLPDKKNKLETRIKRKMVNPVWNEVFTFEGIPKDKLVQRSLHLQVIDYDRFSRNDPIGETELALDDVELQQEPLPFVRKLTPCKRPADYYGDLLFSICCNSSRITLVIMKCANLKLMDITRSCDPYVKIYLVCDGKRIEKRKTEVKRRSPDAVWNESFEFEVPNDKLRDLSLVLTVVDFDRVLPNEAIGQVVVGYRHTGTSLKHWTEMMNHPRKTIAMWHKIKGLN